MRQRPLLCAPTNTAMGADAEKGKYASPEGCRTWEYLATFACIRVLEILLWVLGSILMFCIGSAMGWNSPTSVKLLDKNSPIQMSMSDTSTLMSLIAIGQMLAPPLNSVIVDRIGRKNTILIAGIPLIISWALIALAESVMVLYVARFAAGLSQGIGFCVCYMYVGEISSTSTRGVANVLMIIMLNLGMLMAFAVGPPLSIARNAWLNLGLSTGFLALFWFMPESPYHLMMLGRGEEAQAVLEQLRGRADASEELEQIERSLRSSRKLQESQTRTSVWALLSGRACRRAILIIGLFSVTHHFGGYMAVLMYGQLIFRDLKTRLISDYAASVVNGLVQLLSVGLTSFFVDRWGRRPLVALSGVAAGLCNLVVGLYFYCQEYAGLDVSGWSWLPLAAVFLVVFAFNCGLLIVQGILISELFAPEVKALGVCAVTINGGVLFTVSTKLYLMVVETWHCGHSPPFLFFALLVWTVTSLLFYITPETKGKTLLEIQKALLE